MADMVGHPPNHLLIDKQLPCGGINSNLTHFTHDATNWRCEHHGYRPEQTLADNQIGRLTSELRAYLHDNENIDRLAGNEGSNINGSADMDVDVHSNSRVCWHPRQFHLHLESP